MKNLTLTSVAHPNDKLSITIVKQKKYVYFSAFIDNCGNDFQIDIKELKEFLK